MNHLEYKGFIGNLVFDNAANLFHGDVLNSRDFITFQGRSIDELYAVFKESVDVYLDWCAEQGEQPSREDLD